MMRESLISELGHLTLGTRLRQLGERLQSETAGFAAIAGVAIPAGWFPLMEAIGREPGIAVKELATRVGLSQPGVTRVVIQMTEAGYARITESTTDRRRRLVSLSDEGEDLLASCRQRIWPAVEAAAAEVCAGLSGTFLDELAQIEARLDELPLERRAALVVKEAAR